MNEERWVRNLTAAARGYNEPPKTPRERMWQEIDAARAETRRAAAAIRPARWWSRRQVLWPAAVVAALVVGLTVGRITGPAETGTPQATVASDEPQAPSSGSPNSAYRLAALPLLQRSETLLLQVRTGVEPGNAGETFSGRAATLLTQTRLLLGSPAAEDPELQSLLQDLELSLARIVRLAADPRPEAQIGPERQTLQDGLDRKAVLPRIRDQLAAGPVVVGS